MATSASHSRLEHCRLPQNGELGFAGGLGWVLAIKIRLMGMDPRLEAYLKICREIYERRILDGSWPWMDDSQEPENMIDSENNNENL